MRKSFQEIVEELEWMRKTFVERGGRMVDHLDGGFVFPQDVWDGMKNTRKAGMTLRQHYAGKALNGILSGRMLQDTPDAMTLEMLANIARDSWILADMMLMAERGNIVTAKGNITDGSQDQGTDPGKGITR